MTEITTLDTVKDALLGRILKDMDSNYLEGAATWAGIYSQLVNADAQMQMTRETIRSQNPFTSYGGTDDD